jgi:hypothetical protein
MTRTVASFTCDCSASDEVREPAPETVDCWNCRKPLAMRRWRPRNEPPFVSARVTTAAERARIAPLSQAA